MSDAISPREDNPTDTEARERRGWVRHMCSLKGRCQPVTALEAGNRWPVQTRDLSGGGVALLVCRRFEPGTLLSLELIGAKEEEVSMPLVRVQRADREGQHWVLGCTWAKTLDRSDLRTLLGTAWQAKDMSRQGGARQSA